MAKALLPSPIGPILVACDGAQLISIHILADDTTYGRHGDAPPGTATAEAVAQLRAYFEDGHAKFDLPLAPLTSPAGEKLRRAIRAIGPGDTQSYGEVAKRYASSPRAVGQACARNPFPIVIPCHRVVGSGGTIGHYSGGRGIITKRWLLDHERRGGLL